MKARPRKRLTRGFPASSFEDALVLAQAIQSIAAGKRVRRLTLFDSLGKSPDSGPSRQLVTNSSKYGLTIGSYKAEFLELTADGAIATATDVPLRDQVGARFKLAIEGIPAFAALNQHLRGNKLPSQAVLRDFLADHGVNSEEATECLDTFVVNAKFLGLLRTIAGAERLIPIDQVLEDSPQERIGPVPLTRPRTTGLIQGVTLAPDWRHTCFYLTPIGSPESEERQHSDLFLSSLIEPAASDFDLKVVRADMIGKAGMITAQVIEHIVRSRLVVADLSFHNPNVFYELCLRHACRLPCVQVIRESDPIPFDLEQFRTVRVNTTSIYALVPRLETYRSEIATQIRQVLSDPDAADNPLSTFFPGLGFSVPPVAA